MFFMKERAPAVMKENGFKSCAEAAKLLGQVWAKMSDEEKKPYQDMNLQDIKRQKTQLQELAEKGSFTLEDGTNSSTLTAKPKKARRSP